MLHFPVYMGIHGSASVFAALIGNSLIAILKLAGFFITNSSSLFAEAIHSIADTANQALLLVGLRRSVRKADEHYSYGYGGERFFWALISACGVLFVGAGVTVYHGVHALFSHETPEIHPFLFVVLGVSFCVELFTLWRALRELRAHHPHTPLRIALREGDPVTVAVVYEDAAGVLGVCAAALGLGISILFHSPVFDALGALVIGGILGCIAVILINKNREFLLRKSIPDDLREEIVTFLESLDSIDSVLDFKSSVLDIGKYHIKCEVEWNATGILNDIRRDETLREIHERIATDFTEFKRLLVDEVERIPRLIGREIDVIEKNITERFPEIAHIDIEIN